MANSNSNHWSQSFRPHVVIQDAWEQSQDPETHHEHPASAKAAFVAQAANQANLRQQAQRAIHASWTDQYSHHGLISTDNASQWQQAHMAQQPQQMQQTQQAQQHQHQHQPQYPSGQQYTRQPVTNPPSSLYSSNTSRRAQVLAPNPSRSASGLGTAAPTHQQDPKSNQVPNSQSGIIQTAHSRPGRPQIASPPSGSTGMSTAARTSSLHSSISPAFLQKSQNCATPRMLKPFNASNPGTREQPAAFLPFLPLAAPQPGEDGRPGSYANGALHSSIQNIWDIPDVWANGPPLVETPPDTQAPTAKRRRLQHGTKHAVNPFNGIQEFSKNAHRSHSRAHLKMRNNLVESIDAKDAALKESYDPATIARDILINADKHPTEPNLNHHLEILSQKIPSVTITSDLATLRWDLLDPVGPRDIPQGSPAPSRPNALGALPFVPPSYHSRQLPSPPAPAPVLKFARPTLQPPPRPLPSSSPPLLRSAPPPMFTRPSVPTPNSTPTPTPAPVRQSVVELPSSSKQTPAPIPPQTTKPASPSSPRLNPPRTQMQVVIPTSPRGPPHKKGHVGRPGKTAPSKSHLLGTIHHKSTVSYPVFHCKWLDCEAELHNLQTLQSHVLKVHIPHNLQCGWGECADPTPRAAANMWEHVTSQHLEEAAWASGDGPVIRSADDYESSGFPLSLRNPRPGTMTLPANENTIDAFSRVHGPYNHKEKAGKFRDGGIRWKVGTGVDTDASNRSLSQPAMQPFVPDLERAITINNP
ncbi:hypothetical protein N7448_008813 [Penicillium atrosanguineum]|nr:hypothetical protein N7448_008813 [Penicillium atrosanguineum]